MSPFSAQSINDGTFTRFVSITVMGVLTIAMATVYIVAFIYHTPVPEIFSTFLIAGMVFFSKASGVVDGASIGNKTIEAVVPPIVASVNAMESGSNQSDGK